MAHKNSHFRVQCENFPIHLRGELEALARKLGSADKIIMSGFVPNPTPFCRTANLFALSSNHKGFGNVIVEAPACGLPVVSTDCPNGPAEIFENGRSGRLTPVGDAEALADAMAGSRSRLSITARRFNVVVQTFRPRVRRSNIYNTSFRSGSE